MIRAVVRLPHRFRQLSWVLASVAWVCCASANAAVPEYDLKAALLYKFTKFVLWPDSAFTSTHGSAHLCIIGHDEFGSSIDTLRGQKVQGQVIEIQRLPDVAHLLQGGLSYCQIAFISRSERERLPALISALATSPVLTVSDIDGFAGHGGMIGFVTVDSKIGFEINPGASRRVGIQIGAQLLQVATLVNDTRSESRP